MCHLLKPCGEQEIHTRGAEDQNAGPAASCQPQVPRELNLPLNEWLSIHYFPNWKLDFFFPKRFFGYTNISTITQRCHIKNQKLHGQGASPLCRYLTTTINYRNRYHHDLLTVIKCQAKCSSIFVVCPIIQMKGHTGCTPLKLCLLHLAVWG